MSSVLVGWLMMISAASFVGMIFGFRTFRFPETPARARIHFPARMQLAGFVYSWGSILAFYNDAYSISQTGVNAFLGIIAGFCVSMLAIAAVFFVLGTLDFFTGEQRARRLAEMSTDPRMKCKGSYYET